MADEWQVHMEEEDRLFQLTLDHRGGAACSWRKRWGEQERTYDGGWRARFREGWEKKGVPDAAPAFAVGRIQEKHRSLIAALSRSGWGEWRIRFRGRVTRRCMRRRARKRQETISSLFTVQVRLRPGRGQDEIRVAEGNARAMEFNVEGLIRRLEAVSENQKSRIQLSSEHLPVVLHAGEGGVFFHEILGHALEADYVLQSRSPFRAQDLNRRLLPEALTVRTLDGRDTFFSAVPCDDEGEKRHDLILVERGIIRHWICDLHHARLLRSPEQGHGRIEDFTCLPQPRMYSLYLMPGVPSPEEILASVPRGIFAREFGGGQVDLLGGKFWFQAAETYLLERGRLTSPLGAMRFSGEVREVLDQIEMVGNDFTYDRGVCHCRKNGQALPVRVGQPTVKIAKLAAVQMSNG